MTTPHPDRSRRSADLASPAGRSGHPIGALGALSALGALGALGALALLAAAPLACASPVPPVSAQASPAAAFPDARTGCFGALCVGRPLPTLPDDVICDGDLPERGSASLHCHGSMYGLELADGPFPDAWPNTIALLDREVTAFALHFAYGDGGPDAAVAAVRAANGPLVAGFPADDPDTARGRHVGLHATTYILPTRGGAAPATFRFGQHAWAATFGAAVAEPGAERLGVMVHFDPEAMSHQFFGELQRALGARSREALERDFQLGMVQTDVMVLVVPTTLIPNLRRVPHVRFVEPVYPFHRVSPALTALLGQSPEAFAARLDDRDYRLDDRGRLIVRVSLGEACAADYHRVVPARLERTRAELVTPSHRPDRVEVRVPANSADLANTLGVIATHACVGSVESEHVVRVGPRVPPAERPPRPDVVRDLD